MPNQTYQAKKYSNSAVNNLVQDTLVVEEALKISINNEVFSITMRTPGHDKELVLGLLYSEDIYTKSVSNLEISSTKEDTITTFNLNVDDSLLRKGYLNSRSLLSVASCGICGKTDLDEITGKIKSDETLKISSLKNLFERMEQQQDLFKKSGGSHAAAIFSQNEKFLTLKEDIGRHNAVDKVVGELIIQEKLKEAFCLLVSGRVSYEIIIKAFRAKIPILAAVSAPSSLAVDFAKELGITLLGFCRNGNATCYANDYRIEN